MTATVWVNGEPEGRLDPADRGLAYGDGLFETLRLQGGQAVLADRHWERLAESCRRLCIPIDIVALRGECERLWQGWTGVARLQVTRGTGGRGYLPAADSAATRILSLHELPARHDELARTGIRAGICRQPIGISPLLAGMKHLNRLEQVLLRRELDDMARDEALVCDVQGRVVEGVFSNVFMVKNGRLLTPELVGSGVAGVMRAALLAWAQHDGVPVLETELLPQDFLEADEVFFCNSLYGIWPVRELAGREYASEPLSLRLQHAMAALFQR